MVLFDDSIVEAFVKFRTFRKIPKEISEKLNLIIEEQVIVSVRHNMKKKEEIELVATNLKIDLEKVKINDEFDLVPLDKVGKYSTQNINGIEIKRKDLPKIKKTRYVLSPNFGDYSKGVHLVPVEYQAYVIDNVPPKNLSLKCRILNITPQELELIVTINQTISKKDKFFEEDLLFMLNLMQEVLGVSDVYKSEVGLDEYIKQEKVNWEIFPNDTVDVIITKLKKNTSSITSKEESEITSRIALFKGLKPECYLSGVGKFSQYFGAKFADDLIVFENFKYGNAIYILYSKWSDLSKLPRREILRMPSTEFDRIPHIKGWEKQLKKKIKSELIRRNKY